IVPSIKPLGRSSCAKPHRPPISATKTHKNRITREVRPFIRPHEARNFNKRSLLPTPGHAGTARWNRSPQEWLLPLYKVELIILLNKEGICRKGRQSPPEATTVPLRIKTWDENGLYQGAPPGAP